MSDANYLQWNLPNWITVLFMVIIGTAALNTLLAFVKSHKAA